MKHIAPILALLFSNYCHGKEIDGCMAIEFNNVMSAIFPVIKERSNWEWHRIEVTRETAEYAWIAEPGTLLKKNHQKSFQGNGMTFVAFLGATDLSKITPGSGALEDLIASSEKIAYLTGETKNESWTSRNLDFIRRSKVDMKLLDDDAVLLATINKTSTDAAKQSNPTHMRMRAILPYPGESYECLVKIKKVNKSARIINK
ncbi:hypothetical protein [Ralstonia sp. UBA689]|uniref:hypothetical protein n=1 Tax=Ralstonia sp. UBA689 TaxID=1947373 RepID=UPI0025F81F62|nr:hypothetical protein [Ralstonia sp. UBA689]